MQTTQMGLLVNKDQLIVLIFKIKPAKENKAEEGKGQVLFIGNKYNHFILPDYFRSPISFI